MLHSLLDTGAGFVERIRQELRFIVFVGLVRSDWGEAARSCGVAVGPAGVTLVTDSGTRLNIRGDVEQRFEMRRIGRFASGQVESDEVSRGVALRVDFRGGATARKSKSPHFLPPLTPAADTCARTMVESKL